MVAVPSKLAHDALRMIEYRDMPAVLVMADSAEGLARMRQAAERAGCRVSGEAAIAEGEERFAEQIGGDAVLIDIEEDGGARLDRLLDALDAAAREGAMAAW